jgi:hypothetical protein
VVAVTAPAPASDLTEVVRRVQPVTLAGERVLPVTTALRPLFPEGGLRRGSTVGVSHSTSLLFSLVAEATTTGSWVAMVGMPSLGVVAATEAGVDLDRVAFVPRPPRERWIDVVAALIDGVDIVVVHGRADRRLASRVRERGCVLVVADPRPEVQLDVRLGVTDRSWRGIGKGHGHLDACEIQVAANGRGAASRQRRKTLRLAG